MHSAVIHRISGVRTAGELSPTALRFQQGEFHRIRLVTWLRRFQLHKPSAAAVWTEYRLSTVELNRTRQHNRLISTVLHLLRPIRQYLAATLPPQSGEDMRARRYVVARKKARAGHAGQVARRMAPAVTQSVYRTTQTRGTSETTSSAIWLFATRS